ncbi:unnamed protein product [Cuscuta epithymum]|uniref:Uncharacterized protein n=1 Tax=Cuscuta epithymum TaxID=186058 RepID=A0AAV0GEB1_9ASTE|nr:unnamed protein product [Cuscuta epithymum]CAH9145701.1 unnamed protein product [Cuscuta epithymum]
MGSSFEPSSSISFTSSPQTSNGSTGQIGPNTCGYNPGFSLEMISLNKLSNCLESLLSDSSLGYCDADFVVEGISIGIHRCILAARSRFFHLLFSKDNESGVRPRYLVEDLLPFGDGNTKVGYEAIAAFLSYLYTGKLKPSPPEASTCVDSVCTHDSCRPAINFAVEMMFASSAFQVPELVSLFQTRLLNFVGRVLVDDVIPILGVAFHCKSTELLNECINRVARSDLDIISIEREVPHEVAEHIKLYRTKPQPDENKSMQPDPLREKRIKRIHKALDSDDVELVKLLLTESSDVTLNEAYALHYAASYCDPKVVSEVLGLGLADVNLRNSRGYTALHVAAKRKDPSIIVSLLTKGACVLETTWDGQSAVSICRRLTRPKDYHAKTEQGQEANKDRICIDVLEREILRKHPMAGDGLPSSPIMASDDLHIKLLHLENRVAFARLLFPVEAKLAMEIANAEAKAEFGNFREVDLNETPIMQKKRLFARMESLSKTVELGQRYFPNCSQVLDNLMEDDLPDLFYLEKGTSEEQKHKRKRFKELKDDVQRAFNKDMAESRCSILSPSLSCTSSKDTVGHKFMKI